MKQGDQLDGYTVLTRPTNDGGGKCAWAIAGRDGKEFFIKEFLEPKWPLNSSPGNEQSKQRRRNECLAFEQRHHHVMDRLKSDSVGGGNIVIAEAFFRNGTTYYKVTRRIDSSNLPSLVGLTANQKALVLRTLALSLQQLHRIGIVHGDLKPNNVLVQKREHGDVYTAKLIDFDDSYLAGQPPSPDTVVGDTLYGAPEWLSYIQGEGRADGTRLTTAVDMFALGLMLHEYLTGERPGFPSTFSSPAEAVKAGVNLSTNLRLHPQVATLVLALTDANPRRRPRIEAFFEAMDDEMVLRFPNEVAERRTPWTDRPSRLKINIGFGSGDCPVATDPEPKDTPRITETSGREDPKPSIRTSRVRIRIDPGEPKKRS